MKESIWRLTVRSEFCAGHALRHYEGKCENLHGHNFGVEATVQGNKLIENVEMLMDFKELKLILKKVLTSLDHQVLNSVPPFDRINPSSENLSRHIWQSMAAELVGSGVSMYSVTVSEKSAQSATYIEKDM